MSPPNILLIHSDQHRFDCVGANGHPLLKTPHLDRLAAGGVNFTHAFCPIPLCVPARNSLLNGQWPARHLCIANYDTEAPRPARDLPTFSRALRDAGYFTGYVGKWHVDQHRAGQCDGLLDVRQLHEPALGLGERDLGAARELLELLAGEARRGSHVDRGKPFDYPQRPV